MMKAVLFSCVLLIALPKYGKTQISIQGNGTEWLFGRWKGEGQLFGKDADFMMNWSSTLNNQFIHLNFRNEHDSPEGVKRILNGEAFYKIKEGEVNGYWFDSRGMTLPLKGNIKDEVLTILWGDSKTEQGKTIYKKTATGIAVEDYYMKDGAYHLFGTSSYTKHK